MQKIGFSNYSITETGKIFSHLSKKWRKTRLVNGYPSINIKNDSDKMVWTSIHLLVAKMFIENPLNLKYVNHRDGNKSNNRISNLEWCDMQYNAQHAVVNRLSDLRKHDDRVIHEICKKMQEGWRNCDIEKEFNISNSLISKIRTGVNYKEISSQYDTRPLGKGHRISPNKARDIIKLLLEKELSVTQIKEKLKVSREVINNILCGKIFTEIEGSSEVIQEWSKLQVELKRQTSRK